QRRLRAQGDAQLAGVVPLTRELELLIGEHMGLLVLSESRVGGSRNCSPWRGRVAPSRQLLHRRSHCERLPSGLRPAAGQLQPSSTMGTSDATDVASRAGAPSLQYLGSLFWLPAFEHRLGPPGPS